MDFQFLKSKPIEPVRSSLRVIPLSGESMGQSGGGLNPPPKGGINPLPQGSPSPCAPSEQGGTLGSALGISSNRPDPCGSQHVMGPSAKQLTAEGLFKIFCDCASTPVDLKTNPGERAKDLDCYSTVKLGELLSDAASYCNDGKGSGEIRCDEGTWRRPSLS